MKRLKSIYILICIILPMTLIACSKDSDNEDSLNTFPSEISMSTQVVGKNFEYQLTKTSSTDYFRSTDEYVCTVDTNGLVKAVCCGEATIYAYTRTGTKEIKVKVAPSYSTYTEPYMDWNKSFSQMKDVMGSKYKLEANNDTTVLMLCNKYEQKAEQCGYVFEIKDKDTSLIAVQLFIPQLYENETAFFLLERYVLVDKDTHILINGVTEKSCNTVIQMVYYKTYAVVTYYSFEYMKRMAGIRKESTRSHIPFYLPMTDYFRTFATQK